MTRKMTVTRLIIAAIMITAFFAAAFAPVKTYAKTAEGSAVINIAKVDFENRSGYTDVKSIASAEVPLAASPAGDGINMTLWAVLVSVSALITGIVIFEDIKDKRSDNIG